MAGAACKPGMRSHALWAAVTLGALGSSRSFGDGSCWDLAGVWCPPYSCNHSRLHVTAPCSNWPVTLRVLGGGAGLCGAAMATGPFNENEHAVTNDIPEPIGYTANGQFAAALTQTHLDVVKAHWRDDSFPSALFHRESISVLKLRLSFILIHLQALIVWLNANVMWWN